MSVSNKNKERIVTGISEVHLAELEHQEFKNKKELLEKFGKIETICQSVYNYEFLITEGFKEKANNTFECIRECVKIAEGYPYVRSLETKENMFHLILTKEKK